MTTRPGPVAVGVNGTGASDAAVLPEFASAIATVKQTQKCLSTLDTSLTPSATPPPSVTPSPTPSR